METFKKGDRVQVKKDQKHLNPEFRGIEGTILSWRADMYIVKLDKPSSNGFTELCLYEQELNKI